MHLARANPAVAKGWHFGGWNTDLGISVGYANVGIDDPHLHIQVTEIYLVARGITEMRVSRQTVILKAGDVIVIDPGEAHTFLSCSSDYCHFVIHTPGLSGDQALADKRTATRADLGL
jgi:mannose-6-phosphate isomerase-like protein (cupin superfamily)